MLGPIHATESDRDEKVLEISKSSLLNEALVILGSNLRLQRLYSEYEEMIELKKSIFESDTIQME